MIPADQPLFLPSCHSYVRTAAVEDRFGPDRHPAERQFGTRLPAIFPRLRSSQ